MRWLEGASLQPAQNRDDMQLVPHAQDARATLQLRVVYAGTGAAGRTGVCSAWFCKSSSSTHDCSTVICSQLTVLVPEAD